MTMSNSTPNGTDTNAGNEAEAARKAEEAKKAARKARNEQRKASKAELVKFASTDEFGKLPKAVQAAIKFLAPEKASGGRGGVSSVYEAVRTMFPKVGHAIGELDIFKQTKKGRGEFRKYVRTALKKAEPAKRLWIEFDEAKESWTLRAEGATPPKGWTGYVPADD